VSDETLLPVEGGVFIGGSYLGAIVTGLQKNDL